MIHLFTGMTPDARIFSELLPRLPGARVAEWIEPRSDESLVRYSARVAQLMPRQGDDILGGVSFGGFVAYEVARILRPRGCVLISSVCSPLEMPPVMRACRPLAALGESFLASIGALATSCPRRLRSGSTSRLRKLAGERGRWRRWATSAVLGWRPVSEPFPCPVLQIHGSADATFPHRYTRPDVTISRGGHIIALTHPTEVAAAIRGFTHSLGVEVADR